jgi:GWxTD domain-containing protein
MRWLFLLSISCCLFAAERPGRQLLEAKVVYKTGTPEDHTRVHGILERLFEDEPVRADPGLGAYGKWLEEDAAYIISQKELAEFRRLSTDKQREQFIEQFWLRRDPSPGTEQNEEKEEHYRRIKFAMEKFAIPGVAGWQTDRGRLYIAMGPPDEIDARGKTETWRYKKLDGTEDSLEARFEAAKR